MVGEARCETRLVGSLKNCGFDIHQLKPVLHDDFPIDFDYCREIKDFANLFIQRDGRR